MTSEYYELGNKPAKFHGRHEIPCQPYGRAIDCFELQHLHIHYIGPVSTHTLTLTHILSLGTHWQNKQRSLDLLFPPVVKRTLLLIDCSGGNKINL